MPTRRWAVLLALAAAAVAVGAPTRPAAAAPPAPIVVAFYDGEAGDYSELAALDQYRVTYLATTGISLMADGGIDTAGDAQTLVALTHQKGVRVVQMVQNYRNGGFQPGDLRLLASAAGRRGLS